MSGDIEVTAVCANCGAALTGPFCAMCGQPRHTHRGSLLALLHDLFSDIAGFDSRILRTAAALLFQPGELACAFRDGRTQRYVPPVRLYLFVSLLFFLTLSVSRVALLQIVLVPMPAEVTAKVPDGAIASQFVFFRRLGSVHSSVSPAQELFMHAKVRTSKSRAVPDINKTLSVTFDRLKQDPAALNGALTEWLPRALFLLLPLFALLLALFYRHQCRDYFFVDHMVFSLGFHSFAFVALLGAVGLAQFLPGDVVIWLLVIATAVYLFFAMRRFYRQGWLWTGVKFTSLSLIYGGVVLVPAFFGIVALSIFHP